MINIAELKESDIGRLVTYRSRGGDKAQRGKISSWNDTFIFVNYINYPDIAPGFYNPTAAATSPEDLKWVEVVAYSALNKRENVIKEATHG